MSLFAGVLHHPNVLEIVRHPWFMSCFIAFFGAQVLKFLFARVRTGRWRVRELVSSGGMPSSHAALVSALATAVGLTDGFDAPEAMIAVGFGIIVLLDAATLRRESGEHARLLNRLIAQINARLQPGERLDVRRLKERIGHKRREVAAGVVLGMAVACLVCHVWDFWK